jgi:Ca-activated chloride channel family protein
MEFIKNISFANPEYFWLLLIVPIILLYYFLRKKQLFPVMKFSNISLFGNNDKTANPKLLTYFIYSISLIFIITALARPQSSLSWQNVTTEGIDIVIALDVSGSMLAEDFKPNRLEAAKQVAMKFIEERPYDRIGLVVFAGEAFTQCPLTTDHDVLLNLFKDVKNGILQDGTAIGDGLATAVARLKDSDAKSKVVILLTDGFNTSGYVPPLTAAEIAKSFGVRVYTIGVGANGYAPMPYKTPFGTTEYQKVEVRIDEQTLQKIADVTGGEYFRATDEEALEKIYNEIDKLEKAKIEVTEYSKKSEEFLPLLLIATALILIEFLLTKTIFKSIV